LITSRGRNGRRWIFNVIGWLLGARESGVLLALLLLSAVGMFTSDAFLTRTNLFNVGEQISQLGIMAVGMTFVILSGEIDLSVGSIYALSAVTAGLLIQRGEPIWLSVGAALAAGLIGGLVNGAISTYGRLPSFIVTLGTLSSYRGLTLLVTGGAPISLDSGKSSVAAFSLLGQGLLFGVIPMQLVCMLIVFALGGWLLRWSRYGFHVYAVGGSSEAARLCGIDNAQVKLVAFALSGLLAALPGVLGLSFLNYVQGVTGAGLELQVIAAVIIGGTALFGGSGTMLGTIVGVALIGVLQNVLVLSGISSFWQTFAIGVVILLAVAVDRWLVGRYSTVVDALRARFSSAEPEAKKEVSLK
jgi:ribose/xylose/arabinose/galactoside ABC-type transport system permease subunit